MFQGFGTNISYNKKNHTEIEKYLGQFVNGVRHGDGILYRPGIEEYHGDWKDGKRHGNGTQIIGAEVNEGQFFEDEFIPKE